MSERDSPTLKRKFKTPRIKSLGYNRSKALKFYCSVRCQISRVGSSQVKVKVGGEEQVVGHTIRAKIVKNKVAPPFRKAEFPIWYDGRETDPADEIAAVALIKGLIPRYDSAGNISATGRTYKFTVDNETLIAKKKDDIAIELKKYSKIQDKLIQMIKDGVTNDDVFESTELDSEMSEEEFEVKMKEEAEDIKNGSLNDAEEESGGETNWDNI